MKKSIIFLINGLGIEKPKSYSISIDQTMPNLRKVKETSFFTTAIINSLEYKSAYQSFLLGDTYKKELKYIDSNVIGDKLIENQVFQSLQSKVNNDQTKLHIFIDPTDNAIVESLNKLLSILKAPKDKKIYLHIILSGETTSDYDSIISVVNYIKMHIVSGVELGFVIGKESIKETPTKDELNYTKKLLFMCSAERWTEVDKKLLDLKERNIRPCLAEGFCVRNTCYIEGNDTILFFNTRRNDYDALINTIYTNGAEYLKDGANMPAYSVVKLNTKYNVPSLIDNISYEDSLANLLSSINKKILFITDNDKINIINFYANGMNNINNPNILFMLKDDNIYNREYLEQLINNSPYDLYVFDFHMDVSKTINTVKEQLEKIDIIIGHLSEICMNKHSLFITSLYGTKAEIPIADYNSEKVLLDYEMQIPIFFYDYTYPASKYILAPGETNDILMSAINCIAPDSNLYSLIKQKGLLNNLFKAFK